MPVAYFSHVYTNQFNMRVVTAGRARLSLVARTRTHHVVLVLDDVRVFDPVNVFFLYLLARFRLGLVFFPEFHSFRLYP